MKAYIDSTNGNQVMAIYSHDTDSTYWDGQGYEQHPVVGELEDEITRDHQATIEEGEITSLTASPNPEQPAYTDAREQADLLQLSEIRKSVERISQEISEGNIPDRASNANVDAVMTELENESQTLRDRIGSA